MHLRILLISSVIGVLGVITCIQADPIEVIYTGDSCGCSKRLDYLVNVPLPLMTSQNVPSEHGYQVDCPWKPKAKVTYSFDFTVEKPKTPSPLPEEKWNLYAKIDRITAPKKDCSEAATKTCGCYQSNIANGHVSPESSAARYTRNLRHPNSIDAMEPSSTSPQIMAIFLEPLKQIKRDASKSRKKRDISRIFMRPRKNEKRSDRLVKQYNKGLNDPAAKERTLFEETGKPIASRSISSSAPTGIFPLKRLSSFLTLPSLRYKRDIKGEYDLIEKEREQMDLTLPEIIQYMPETLDPNFKRNQCHFGQRCQHPELRESATKATTTATTNETTATITTTESKEHTQDDMRSVTDSNNVPDENEKKQTNCIMSKRNVRGHGGGCPVVLPAYSPTPSPSYTYEPLTSFEGGIPRPFVNYHSGHDPVAELYVGSSHNPYSPSAPDNPTVGATYTKSNSPAISDAQLDRIIAEIVSKHEDFIKASSHRNGALVDPIEVQEEQNKYYLKSLFNEPWNNLQRHKVQPPIGLYI